MPVPDGLLWSIRSFDPWNRGDLNSRPPACKAGALPAELRPRKKKTAYGYFVDSIDGLRIISIQDLSIYVWIHRNRLPEYGLSINAIPYGGIKPRMASKPANGAAARPYLGDSFNLFQLDICNSTPFFAVLLMLIKKPASISVKTQIIETGTSLEK